MGPRGVFPTNPELANILGDTDCVCGNYDFLDVLDTNFLHVKFLSLPAPVRHRLGMLDCTPDSKVDGAVGRCYLELLRRQGIT